MTLIVDVGVRSNDLAILVKILEHYGRGARKGLSVERELKILTALGGLWSELLRSRNFLTINQQRLTSGLIHQHALKLIFLTGDQVQVADLICDRHVFLCRKHRIHQAGSRGANLWCAVNGVLLEGIRDG